MALRRIRAEPHVDPTRDTHLETNDADERVVLLRLHLSSAAVGGHGQRCLALDAAGPAGGADDAELLLVWLS